MMTNFMEDFDRRFKNDSKEEFEKLKNGDEAERLLAIAKIEERCFGWGIPKFVIDALINTMHNDESVLVRSFAIRALYHPSSEVWPYLPDDRKRVFQAIVDFYYSPKSQMEGWIAGNIYDTEMGVLPFRPKWLKY